MAIPFVTVAIPANPGQFTALQAVGGLPPVLTILSFQDPSAVLVVQESYDAGATWQNLTNIGGPGAYVLEVEAASLRFGLVSGLGGGSVQFAGQAQAGNPVVSNLAVPAGIGASAALDISGQSANLRVLLQTADTNPVPLEVSFDNVNFAQLGNVVAALSTPIVAGTNQIRVNRRSFTGPAGNLQVAGVPAKPQ